MKKIILPTIACIAIGLALLIQININTQKVQKNEPIVLSTATSTKIQKIEPPLIIEGDIVSKDKIKELKDIKSKVVKNLDEITSEAYIVGNLDTGKIYLTHNTSAVFPIASLSKLFTALVVAHKFENQNKIAITQSMIDTVGDAGELVKDEKFTPNELLYPLLLESSNDAAEALAQSYGYENFIKSMNSLALGIGMKHTSFKDASGLNPANVSNTEDLFILAKYFYKNEKALLTITKTKEIAFATTTDHGFHNFVSINPFIDYVPFIGGKTGRTFEARESMISLFNFENSTTTYPIAVILLRSDLGEREIDTEKILDLLGKKMKSDI